MPIIKGDGVARKLTDKQLAEKIAEQHGVLEKIEVPEYNEKTNMPTSKVARKEWTVHIPETLLGINLAGYGNTQKEAKADLASRLAPILGSDELTLSDDWEKNNIK